MPSAAMQADSRPSQPATSRARMSLFSIIRNSLYGTVILFTVICLAMAAHFQSVLASSDLTRFVPFAIFVCTVSLLVFLVLVSFSFFLRGRNPISTRIELACLGLVGLFWLVLGVFLATSDAQNADVECFAPGTTTPVDDDLASFHTDQYQAMYRVLMTFSLFNAVLVIFACLALLFLAIRRHRKGDQHMWHGPVTSCAWFNSYGNSKQTEAKTSSSSILPVASAYMGEAIFTEKPERKASARRERQYPTPTQPYSNQPYSQSYQPRNPYRSAEKARSPAGYTRQGSGSSPRSGSRTTDLENGGMLNPYSRGPVRGSPR